MGEFGELPMLMGAPLTQPSALARKLTEVVLAVDGIAKNRTNERQGYKFASEETFLRAVREPLADRGVLMFPSSAYVSDVDKGDKMTTITGGVTYTFLDSESGERINVVVLASGADMGDKHTYKLMTGALKYALKQTLLLPTGDDPEYEGAPAKPAPRPQPKAPGMTPAQFTETLTLYGLTNDAAKALVGLDADQPWGKKFTTLEAALAAVQKETKNA